jgi:hypothetical protein
MHQSFLIASFLALVALGAMCFVPKRRESGKEGQHEEKGHVPSHTNSQPVIEHSH